MPWRKCRALLGQLPPEAALWRSVDSPRQWGWSDHLLAAAVLGIQSGNWQRGGGKGRKPKAIDPWPQGSGTGRTVGTARPIEEVRDLLDRWAAGALDPDLPDEGDEEEVTDGD